MTTIRTMSIHVARKDSVAWLKSSARNILDYYMRRFFPGKRFRYH